VVLTVAVAAWLGFAFVVSVMDFELDVVPVVDVGLDVLMAGWFDFAVDVTGVGLMLGLEVTEFC
jgi:hypothetical protein